MKWKEVFCCVNKYFLALFFQKSSSALGEGNQNGSENEIQKSHSLNVRFQAMLNLNLAILHTTNKKDNYCLERITGQSLFLTNKCLNV